MPVNVDNVKKLLRDGDPCVSVKVQENKTDFKQNLPLLIGEIHKAWVSKNEGDFASLMALLKMAIGSRYEEEVAPLFQDYPQEFIDDVRSF